MKLTQMVTDQISEVIWKLQLVEKAETTEARRVAVEGLYVSVGVLKVCVDALDGKVMETCLVRPKN